MNPAAPVTAYRMLGGYVNSVRAPLLEPVDLRVADEEDVRVVSDDGRVLAIGERPELAARQSVESVGASLERREVDAPREHRGRARDLPVRPERPFDVAGRGVVAVEGAVVGADVHPPPPDRGRRVAVVAGPMGPPEPAGRGADRVRLCPGRADGGA